MSSGFGSLFDAECGEDNVVNRLGSRFGTNPEQDLYEHDRATEFPRTDPPATFEMERLLSQVTEQNQPLALQPPASYPFMMEAAAFPAPQDTILPIDGPSFTPFGEAIDFHYANYTTPHFPLGSDDWVQQHETDAWDDRLMNLSWHEALRESTFSPAIAEVSFHEACSNVESYEAISVNYWLRQLRSEQTMSYEFEFPSRDDVNDAAWAMAEGRRALAAGDIPTSVYLLENAVHADSNSAEAWFQLGSAQQLNENDKAAIAALHRCLQLDSKHPLARIALAASFTNELRRVEALMVLVEWSDLHLSDDSNERVSRRQRWEAMDDYGGYTFQRRLFDEVEARLHKIVESSPNSEVTANAEVALGILYNISEEYEKAAQHFERAIAFRPDDPILFNRLGASFANGNRNADAVVAYRRSLELSPGLLRTRYNLGIASCNMHAYKEAVLHFLSVLNKQNETRSHIDGILPPRNAGSRSGGLNRTDASASVWTSLRMALLAMDRRDLYNLALEGKLSELNFVFSDDMS